MESIGRLVDVPVVGIFRHDRRVAGPLIALLQPHRLPVRREAEFAVGPGKTVGIPGLVIGKAALDKATARLGKYQ